MIYKTYTELKTQLQQETDTQDEDFVQASELLSYFNEGIDWVESLIHQMGGEDYFLTQANITLVSNTSDYDLPTDIYASKIRAIRYSNGSVMYTLRRIKRFEELDLLPNTQTSRYSYLITNASGSYPKVTFISTPQENGAYIKVWYIRNAKTLTLDADTCDLPEFYQVLINYVKWKIRDKENFITGSPIPESLVKFAENMISTLNPKVEDEQNMLEPDLYYYNEFYQTYNDGGY